MVVGYLVEFFLDFRLDGGMGCHVQDVPSVVNFSIEQGRNLNVNRFVVCKNGKLKPDRN